MNMKQLKAKSNEQIYVDIKLNDQITHAIGNTDATHNFIADQEVRQLGLNIEKNSSG